MTLTTERQQFAEQNEMSMDFVNWFFDKKKDGCGNAWFIMAAAMWEGWKGQAANREAQPVAWLAIYHGEVYDEAIGIIRSVVEAQADRFGWESALTEIIPLYRHAPLAPAVVKLPTEFYSDEGIVVRLEQVMAALALVGVKYERRGDACRAAMLATAPGES